MGAARLELPLSEASPPFWKILHPRRKRLHLVRKYVGMPRRALPKPLQRDFSQTKVHLRRGGGGWFFEVCRPSFAGGTFTNQFFKEMKKHSTNRFPNFGNILATTILLAFFCTNLSAATIYVKPTGDDQNTGLSWAQAYQTLSRALYMAGNGDQIWVAAGTYKPQNQGPSSCAPFFYVGKNVKIYGGFAGTETTLAQRNFVTNETILSGDIGTVGMASDNTRLIWFDHVSNFAALDGFTLTDYRRTDSFNGAAIYNDGSGAGRSSKPTVANCKFLNGTANTGSDGWIVNSSGSGDGDAMLSLSNCTFGAQSQVVANAMLRSSSSGTTGKDKIVANNCIFNNSNGSGIRMGAINSGGVSMLELTNCSLTGGIAFAISMAGGNSAVPSSILMSNCTVSNLNTGVNWALSFGGNVSKTFENCVFSGNSSQLELILSSNFPDLGIPTVFRKCSFMGNAVGGTLSLLYGHFRFENCQFSGNTGNVFNSNIDNSKLAVVNSTFAGNSGLAINGGGCDTLEVKNSIIWANAGGIAPSGNLNIVSHNIVQGGFAGLNNFDLDPDFLAPVAFTAAPTTGGNLRLNNCSPASNSGNNAFVPAGLTTDLDNSPRIFGGATGRVDCGTFEKQNNLTQIAYTDADGDGYGTPNAGIMPYCGTIPTGFAANTTDCNDAVSTINPGVAEVCNGLDDNCDGIVDNVAVCPRPTGLSTTGIMPTQALLNWTGGDCPIAYQVQYRLSTVTTFTTVTVNAPAAGLLLTNLMPGKTYRWRVRAVCPPGNRFSSYTALQTFSTPASVAGPGGGTSDVSTLERSEVADDAQFMSVFPNPNSGEFQIEFDRPVVSGEAFLYDLQGKLILKTTFERGSNTLTLRAGHLPAGIYMLRAEADGAAFRERVLIE